MLGGFQYQSNYGKQRVLLGTLFPFSTIRVGRLQFILCVPTYKSNTRDDLLTHGLRMKARQ